MCTIQDGTSRPSTQLTFAATQADFSVLEMYERVRENTGLGGERYPPPAERMLRGANVLDWITCGADHPVGNSVGCLVSLNVIAVTGSQIGAVTSHDGAARDHGSVLTVAAEAAEESNVLRRALRLRVIVTGVLTILPSNGIGGKSADIANTLKT
jgi:hypothetical protein